MANVEEFRKEIELELGAPVIKVELAEESWDAIIKKAKRWFTAKKGVKGCQLIQMVNGIREYDFPANADRILDVIFPEKGDLQSILSLGFSDIPFNLLEAGNLGGDYISDYSAYVQVLQSLETRRRIFSSEPCWEVFCNKIQVLGNQKGSGFSEGFMLVAFSKKDWEVEELDARDQQIFYDYMRAVALHVLGRIRSKYSNYPAAGGSIDMDGSDLINEAKEEYERLEEEISLSQGPMSHIYG